MAFHSMPALTSGSGTSPNGGLGLSHAMASGAGLGIDGFDPEMNFDDTLLEHHGMPMPFNSSYPFDETFGGATYDDPFNYSRPYENAPDQEAYHDESASPQQPDDKLLSFSAPAVKAPLLDDATGAFHDSNMTAELYGMFFVAEDVFGPGESSGRPLELTCYRRNLWQCSGQITLPRHFSQAMNEQGRSIPITEFYASISALESIEGKPTEIISIPWKSNNPAVGEAAVETMKVTTAPPQIPLDLSAGQEIDGHRVSVPISWKRLQFKSATANNGRRKGLQQHYRVLISLLGRAKGNGELIKIAEIQSGPVIVRGRSPRNFDSRKDVQVAHDKKVGNADRTRTQSDSAGTGPGSLKQERTDSSQSVPRINSFGSSASVTPQPNEFGLAPTPTYNGHQQQQNQQPASKKIAVPPHPARPPPVPAWGKDTTSSGKVPTVVAAHRSSSSIAAPSMPINLSLSEDERSPNNRSSSDPMQSPHLNRTGSGIGLGSPPEETEQLYEYFPLSVDDWTPLVDTVYRPHIVHHIAVPQEIKAQKVRSKAKRYFSAE